MTEALRKIEDIFDNDSLHVPVSDAKFICIDSSKNSLNPVILTITPAAARAISDCWCCNKSKIASSALILQNLDTICLRRVKLPERYIKTMIHKKTRTYLRLVNFLLRSHSYRGINNLITVLTLQLKDLRTYCRNSDREFPEIKLK